MLHRDIKPPNLLLDEPLCVKLADFGIAKMAADGAGHVSLSHAPVAGTSGFLDPLLTNDQIMNELTDGFAMGITILCTLTGLEAKGILSGCRVMLRKPSKRAKWCAPGLPDTTAGKWPDAVACGLVKLVIGLSEGYADERMLLPEALGILEALTAAAGGQAATADGQSAEARLCIVCEHAPRAVRFCCGHAQYCNSCWTSTRASGTRWSRECPTCNAPLGSDAVAENGAHVGMAPTFCMPPSTK